MNANDDILPLTYKQELFLKRLLKTHYFSTMLFAENQEILREFIAAKSFPIKYQSWLNSLGSLYTERIIKEGKK
jgi:hypothetical protein